MESYSLRTLRTIKGLQGVGFAHRATQSLTQEIQRAVVQEDLELKKLLEDPEALPIVEILTIECPGCGARQKWWLFYIPEKESYTLPGHINAIKVTMYRGGSRRAHRNISRYLRIDDREQRFNMLMANRELLRYLFSIVMPRIMCSAICKADLRGIKRNRRSIAAFIAAFAYGTADERIKNFTGRRAILL